SWLLVDQAIDARERWALGEEVAQACDRIGVAGNLGFHGAIGPVPDPAADLELAGLRHGPRAVADTLHPACNQYPNPIHDLATAFPGVFTVCACPQRSLPVERSARTRFSASGA